MSQFARYQIRSSRPHLREPMQGLQTSSCLSHCSCGPKAEPKIDSHDLSPLHRGEGGACAQSKALVSATYASSRVVCHCHAAKNVSVTQPGRCQHPEGRRGFSLGADQAVHWWRGVLALHGECYVHRRSCKSRRPQNSDPSSTAKPWAISQALVHFTLHCRWLC